MDTGTPGIPLTPEEKANLASVPVVSGANGPRFKLVNTGKRVLNLASYNFTVSLTTKISKFMRLKPSGNKVSVAVPPLDSMALWDVFFSAANGS